MAFKRESDAYHGDEDTPADGELSAASAPAGIKRRFVIKPQWVNRPLAPLSHVEIEEVQISPPQDQPPDDLAA